MKPKPLDEFAHLGVTAVKVGSQTHPVRPPKELDHYQDTYGNAFKKGDVIREIVNGTPSYPVRVVRIIPRSYMEEGVGPTLLVRQIDDNPNRPLTSMTTYNMPAGWYRTFKVQTQADIDGWFERTKQHPDGWHDLEQHFFGYGCPVRFLIQNLAPTQINRGIQNRTPVIEAVSIQTGYALKVSHRYLNDEKNLLQVIEAVRAKPPQI